MLSLQAEAASGLLLRPAWALLEHELAQAVQQAIHGYWRFWRESHQDDDMWSPEVQVPLSKFSSLHPSPTPRAGPVIDLAQVCYRFATALFLVESWFSAALA